jgi:hypothetical protein
MFDRENRPVCNPSQRQSLAQHGREGTMTEDDLHSMHIKETYAHFGRAVHGAQLLEDAIVTSAVFLQIWRRRGTKIDGNFVETLYEAGLEKTLGKMIEMLKGIVDLSSEVENKLKDACITRNFLVHRYFRSHAVDFMKSEGRDQMIAELDMYHDVFEEVRQEIDRLGTPIVKRLGLTQEKIDEIVGELLRE